MKRLIVIFACFFALFGLMAPTAFAALDPFSDACQGAAASSAVCRDRAQSQTQQNNSIFGPNGILTKAAQILVVIVSVAAVIVIIISGFRYVLSGGDSGNVSRAKSALIFAFVGLIVAMTSQAIISFVLKKL